jgi:hypothetical protein
MALDHPLFSWRGGFEVSKEYHEYSECVLRRDIGPFPKGTRIPNIVLNYEEGELCFVFDDDEKDDWWCELSLMAGTDKLTFRSSQPCEDCGDDVHAYATIGNDIGPFKKGTTFKTIVIDYSTSTVEFQTMESKFHVFPLSLNV